MKKVNKLILILLFSFSNAKATTKPNSNSSNLNLSLLNIRELRGLSIKKLKRLKNLGLGSPIVEKKTNLSWQERSKEDIKDLIEALRVEEDLEELEDIKREAELEELIFQRQKEQDVEDLIVEDLIMERELEEIEDKPALLKKQKKEKQQYGKLLLSAKERERCNTILKKKQEKEKQQYDKLLLSSWGKKQQKYKKRNQVKIDFGNESSKKTTNLSLSKPNVSEQELNEQTMETLIETGYNFEALRKMRQDVNGYAKIKILEKTSNEHKTENKSSKKGSYFEWAYSFIPGNSLKKK